MRYNKLLTAISAVIMSFGVVVAPLGQLANAASGPGPWCTAGQTSPIARITSYTTTAIQAPSALVKLSGQSSTPCEGSSLVSYQWDFGDGTTSSDILVEHTYPEGVWTPTLTVTNQDGVSDTEIIIIYIRATNSAPVAPSFNVDTVLDKYGSTGPVDIISQVSDPDGDYFWIGYPKIVSVSDTSYSPTISYLGNGIYGIRVSGGHVTNDVTVGLEYTATDRFGATSTGIVTVFAAATNQAPVANDITVTMAEDSSYQRIYLSSNVSDPDGDMLTQSIVNGPAHGVIADVTGSSFLYAPNKDFNGTDTIVYTTTDGALTSTGTITINVTPVNDAPVYNRLASFTIQEDTILSGNISSYVSDIEGDALVFESNSTFMTMDANGAFTITPRQDFYGTFYAAFTVTDSSGASIYCTFPVTVTAVNDAPVVSLSYNQEKSGMVYFSSTTTDIDSSVFTYTWDFGDGTPTVTGSRSASHQYSKAKGKNAPASFTATLTVDDGNGGITVKTVTVRL